MIVEIDGKRFVPEQTGKLRRQPFSELITHARNVTGESLDEAATAIGITKSYLWELEQGGSQPTLPLVQMILRHYGLRFEQIDTAQYKGRGK